MPDLPISGLPAASVSRDDLLVSVDGGTTKQGPASSYVALTTDADLQTSDVTTNNVTGSKHGFAPKAPADSTKFLNGADPPAWAVPAGSGGGGGTGALVLLEQKTASASATLDFTAWYASAYDEYVIEFVNVIPATDNVNFVMRMSTDGGATYDSGANYEYAQDFADTTGTGGSAAATAQTSIGLANNIDNATTKAVNGSFRLFGPGSTTAHKGIGGQLSYLHNDTKRYVLNFMGYYLSTTAVNAIRFLMSSGNIASGTIRIYGIANTASQGAVPADGMTLIQEQVLSADAASVTFSSIPQTYRHLVLQYQTRTTEAVTDNYLLLRFNADSGANYDFTQLRAINTSVAGASSYGQTAGRIADIVGASASSAGMISPGELSIPGYALTTFNKTYHGTSGATYGTSGSNAHVFTISGHWRSTAAITSLTILPTANNLIAGSVFSLYGLTAVAGGATYSSPVLGYTSYNPGSDVDTTTTSTTGADIDATNLTVTFTVPASGKVLVRLTALANCSSGSFEYWWTLRDTAGNNITGTRGRICQDTNAANRRALAVAVTGLVPGTSVTYRWGHGVENAGATGHILYGDTGGTAPLGPAVMEVIALP